MQISIKDHIQTLFREIEVYRSQSLFEEAKKKYEELAALIRKSNKLKNKEKLLSAISKNIRKLGKDARAFDEVGATAQMPAKQQNLVKKLFSLPEEAGADSATLEGATALLVFGQFEKALGEFNELFKKDALRVVAAKNILRCHIGLSSFDSAVMQYNQWFLGEQLPLDQLEKIRSFLNDILKKRGLEINLPEPEKAVGVKEDTIPEDEFIDIISAKIPLDDESKKGKGIRLDVSFQKGHTISVIIPRKYQVLIDNLSVGKRLNDVQFYSPSVVFKGLCVVSTKREIKSGPKKGDYALVMKILNS